MLPDPLTSVTLATVAQTLNRISTSGLASQYTNADQTLTMDISHKRERNGRIRTLVRLTQRKIVTDPITQSNDYDTTSVHMVIDRPAYGFTATDVQNLVACLQGWGTSANVLKLFELQH